MLADVDAVDEDGAAGRVVEARDQVDERRLAAAGAADDRRGLARARRGTRCRGGPAPRRPGSGTRRRGTRRRRARRRSDGRPGAPGRGSAGSVSRTSWIRPADTAPRGTRMNMNTAVRTANRIWIRYWRNAVRLPIGSVAVLDADRAEPDDRDRRQVEDRGHRRDREREQAVDPERRCRTGRGWRRRTAPPRAASARRRG